MVRFTAMGENGRILIGLGLEAVNVMRMQAGEPVRVRLSDLGFTGAIGSVDLMIFAGETAATMYEDLQPLLSPDTVVHDERAVTTKDPT